MIDLDEARAVREAALEGAIRDAAWEIVDKLRGYTVEYAADPAWHRREYSNVEEIIRARLASALTEAHAAVESIRNSTHTFAETVRDAIDTARERGKREGVEAAAKACEDERLQDDTRHDEDVAYNAAIDDCVAAILALNPKQEG